MKNSDKKYSPVDYIYHKSKLLGFNDSILCLLMDTQRAMNYCINILLL